MGGDGMDAKAYLVQVKKMDKMIQNKLIEFNQWKSIALKTTSVAGGERVQSSGSHQKMADAVINYVAIEKAMNEEIDRFSKVKQEVIKTIELLPLTEYDVLHLIYIQYKSFDEVAGQYNKSRSWATTIHGRALKHLNEILEGKGAS